ncbi:M48 family peptidase [Thermococcus sp. 21S7]|nr:M48 family peptidase [Thermococcus sp. 21S7]
MTPEEVYELVSRWAKELGVYPKRVRFQKMRHKWASASSKGTLTFSVDILELPYEVVEYIVVHELIHIKVGSPRHNRLFRALLSSYIPEWQALQRELTSYSSPSGVQE